MCMKHMRKSDPYLVIEVEGKARWKKEFIQNLAQINYNRILPVDSNGLWIQYSLAVLSTTSGENSITNVFWFITLIFSVPLSSTALLPHWYFQPILHLHSPAISGFPPGGFHTQVFKLSILYSREGGSRSHQDARRIPKQALQFQEASKGTTKGFSVSHSSRHHSLSSLLTSSTAIYRARETWLLSFQHTGCRETTKVAIQRHFSLIRIIQ